MSRSQDIMQNPCTKFLSWDSENGKFKFWDKEKGEKGENVEVNLPVKFLVLDTLNTVKGFSEKNNSGIWSNEVKKLDETLVVRDSKGVIAEGKYKDIKDTVKAAGGKFTVSVYGLGEDGELINFQLKGASCNSWIEFTQKAKSKIYSEAVVCEDFDTEKKGRTTYTVPKFKLEAISEEANEAAKKADIELQKYLAWYLSKPDTNQPVETNSDY